MRLLDKLALNRLVGMILTFVLSVIKLFIPKTNGDSPSEPTVLPLRKRIWKRNKK